MSNILPPRAAQGPFVIAMGIDPDDNLQSQTFDADGNLLVNVAAGGGGGSAFSDQDESAYVPGLSEFVPVGGVRLDAPTDVAAGQTAAARITPKRAGHVNLRDNSGLEFGTVTNPVRTDPVGSTDQPITAAQLPAALVGGRLDVNIGSGSITVAPVTSNTASSPAQTAVGASAGSVLAANPLRKRLNLQNAGTTRIYIALGAANPTTSAYHFALPAGGEAGDGTSPVWTDTMWTGEVRAISSAPGGFLVVTELI